MADYVFINTPVQPDFDLQVRLAAAEERLTRAGLVRKALTWYLDERKRKGANTDERQ